MGLFDFLKKKKPSVTVSFETISNNNIQYDPWKPTNEPRNDNYAIALFISRCKHGATVGKTNDDYARYFSYRYKVFDPVKYHKKVIADGYLVEASPYYALKKFKVDQLKSILSEAGLPNKGKKDDLISRIMDSVALDTLNLDTYYIPSEKGLEHLKKYEFVFSLEGYGITWQEYDEFKKSKPDYLKPNDIIWQLLNERFNKENMSGYLGNAGSDYFRMGKLLESEGNNLDALSHYVTALYYEASGCYSPSVVYKPDEVYISPDTIKAIHRLKDYYDKNILTKCFSVFPLQQHYISRSNFERLLIDIFEDNPFDITTYMKKRR